MIVDIPSLSHTNLFGTSEVTVLRTSTWCRCVMWWFWPIPRIWRHPFPCLCLGRSVDKFRASHWNGKMVPKIQTMDSHSLGSTVLSILSPIGHSRFPEKRRVRIHNTSLENSQLPTVFSSRDFLNLVWYLQLSMNLFSKFLLSFPIQLLKIFLYSLILFWEFHRSFTCWAKNHFLLFILHFAPTSVL